jgi:hypothetical protein
MRPPLALLLIAVALGMTGAAVAAAAGEPATGTIVATPRFVPVAGPVFAGDGGVAWVSRRDDAVLDLWVAEPGLGPRRVQRFSGADGERLRRPRLSASVAEVGLRFTETRAGGAASVRSYRGPFGQPLRPVADGAPVASVAVDAAGRRLQVTRGCANAEIRIVAAVAAAAGESRAARGAGSQAARGAASWAARGAASGAVAARETGCPLRLRSHPRLRAGRLRLGVSCAGFAIDCSALVTVRIGDRVIARGRARYNHATPPFAAVSLELGRRGLRLLRSRPRTRLRIAARIGSARAIAAGWSAGTVKRSTTRTIVRALAR